MKDFSPKTSPDPSEVVTFASLPSGTGGTTNTYIQQTEPTPTAGTGAFIWYVTDGSGNVTDIRYGVA